MVPSTETLAAGELTAAFLPRQGMLGVSFRHRGEELLGLVEDIDAAAEAGSVVGIPLLHPWANRLAALRYAACGREAVLTPASSLLHLDGNGLPIHGVPWSRLAWRLTAAGERTLSASLDWETEELLGVFPFPHRLDLSVALDSSGLTLALVLDATGNAAVPVSFGFHPYLTLPGADRDRWHLVLPAMRRLLLDERGIPTGREVAAPALARRLAGLDLDDGYAGLPADPRFTLEGGGRRVTVSLLEGYTHAQIFAPAGRPFVALEPMTAPTNALVSGAGLRQVAPGRRFRAVFRIEVEGAA